MSRTGSSDEHRTFFLKDLNTHLVCSLCDGYFREAHTVPDCLHTFCKCCLFKEFAKKALKDAKSCPSCKFNLGLRPYDKVVYDRNLQALVDKIFPNFSLQDKLLEEQFNAAYDHEEASNKMYDLPQVTRPPISLKRPLQQEIIKSVLPPTKKPQLSGSTSSTTGSSSSGNRSALSSNKSSSAGGDSKSVEEFSGLTLRVVPYEPSSNPISSDTANSPTSLLSPQESALAPLTRPLLKVNGKTVAVDQIQRFIHKRLGGPEAFLPKAIEILRDGVVQHSSWRIGQTPHLTNDSVIDVPHSSARPDGTIILAYRRK